MRNYEKEIEKLRRYIKDLELKKRDKEAQLQRVLRDEKRNDSGKKTTQAVDKSGKAIYIGDQVIATTIGKF